MRTMTNPGLIGPRYSGRNQRDFPGPRHHAYFSSMEWWGQQILRGGIYGGVAIGAGTAIWLLASFFGESTCFLARFGLLVIALGVFIALFYFASPYTRKWIVPVPEGYYYVVEDNQGNTIEYIGPGPMIVPWRWRTVARDYVEFDRLLVEEVVEDVLNSSALRVDIHISTEMHFNPAQADPNQYGRLRRLRVPEQFRSQLSRNLRDVTRRYVGSLRPLSDYRLLASARTLEAAIEDDLRVCLPLGLFPIVHRPVAVYVQAPQRVKEAYDDLFRRATRLREEADLVRDLKDLARELDLPYSEAFQLFYIMQRSAAEPEPVENYQYEPELDPSLFRFDTTETVTDWARQRFEMDQTIEHSIGSEEQHDTNTAGTGADAASNRPPEATDQAQNTRPASNRPQDPMDLRRDRKRSRRADK